MNRYLSRDKIVVLAALIAPLAAAGVLLPFHASWPNTNVALLMVVVVVGVAALGSRFAGALAAVGAAVWFDFFFTLPYDRFVIASRADVTTFLVLLLVGLAVSQLAAWARRMRVIALTDAGYLSQIHEVAALAVAGGSSDEIVRLVTRQVTGLLKLESCRFEYGMLIGRPPRLESDGSLVTQYGERDVDTAGLPEEEIELRVFGNGQYYGRFMMKPKPDSHPGRQARLVAVTLAEQVGRAFSAAEVARPSAPARRS